jgi:lysophospholipase L1-like esterase
LSSAGEATRIFVFGGSTIWGPAVRDDYTIPSHLSKLLAGAGLCAEVTNHGETGYVSTQELILLMRALQKGDVPDLVVLYDGVNELFSAIQNNEVGLPQNEDHRRREFNLLLDGSRLRSAYLSHLFQPKGLTRLRAAVQARIRPGSRGGAGLEPTQAGTFSNLGDKDSLISGMIRAYKSNLGMVRLLGERYGFATLFYWQPMIFSKRSVSDYEQSWVDRSAGLWKDFITRGYARIEDDVDLKSSTSFRNLAGIFDDFPEPYYVDSFHLTEDGNRVIAEAIADDVAIRLRARASRR